MSVYPEFLQHIHDEGLYVHGYNYEAMYNIMVYTITYNVISTNNFIYTYNQMNNLYEYLEELLIPLPLSDPSTSEEENENITPIINQQHNLTEDDEIQYIQNEDDTQYDEIQYIQNTEYTENTEDTEIQDENQYVQTLFNNYINLLNTNINVPIFYNNLTHPIEFQNINHS